VLDRSLIAMRHIIDRSLADVRVTAGLAPRRQLISLANVIGDVKSAMSLEAQDRGCELAVSFVDSELAVESDRDMLLAAVSNLLQNAFKFTQHRSCVSLSAYAAGDRIRIDVEDNCGGLPPGGAERMFLPFTQCSEDRTGLGLGLAICRRSVEANNGALSVRDVPGSGCVFTIELPRHSVT
jgi:signal transduction histidine kinase